MFKMHSVTGRYPTPTLKSSVIHVSQSFYCKSGELILVFVIIVFLIRFAVGAQDQRPSFHDKINIAYVVVPNGLVNWAMISAELF